MLSPTSFLKNSITGHFAHIHAYVYKNEYHKQGRPKFIHTYTLSKVNVHTCIKDFNLKVLSWMYLYTVKMLKIFIFATGNWFVKSDIPWPAKFPIFQPVAMPGTYTETTGFKQSSSILYQKNPCSKPQLELSSGWGNLLKISSLIIILLNVHSNNDYGKRSFVYISIVRQVYMRYCTFFPISGQHQTAAKA